MCLKDFSVNLEWDEVEECFVGYGWKKMKCLDANGNISVPRMKKNVGGVDLGNYWFEAKGHKDNKGIRNESIIGTEMFGQTYFPGFHIFRDFEDAKNYPYISGPQVGIVKVKFTELITVGTNWTGTPSKDYLQGSYGVCYAAKYIKLLNVYDEETNGDDSLCA